MIEMERRLKLFNAVKHVLMAVGGGVDPISGPLYLLRFALLDLLESQEDRDYVVKSWGAGGVSTAVVADVYFLSRFATAVMLGFNPSRDDVVAVYDAVRKWDMSWIPVTFKMEVMR